METHILVIDDDKKFVKSLKKVLKVLGRVDTGYTVQDFYKLFSPHKYDIILVDLRLEKEYEGLELIRYIVEEDPSVPVIVITGYASVDSAIDAIHLGASLYLQKDKITFEEILVKIKDVLSSIQFKYKMSSLIEELEIIGEDPKIKDVIRLATLVANDGEATVLLHGETGTGKELIARFIHRTGKRKDGPFISVAIPALNKSTVVSELFGHEKGAFTGAMKKHVGYIEQAHKGILFLDEIGELDTETQVKLLRFLDSKIFRRMGGDRDLSVDVQIVAATNRDLKKLVEEGAFREDLYYRLKVFEIELPPLRERKGDIVRLANYFLTNLFQKNRTTAREFSEEVIDIFQSHTWPGNVRELKQVVESAALKAKLTGKTRITTGMLPEELKDGLKSKQIREGRGVEYMIARTELEYIQNALEKTNWKKNEAWKLLGYSSRFVLRRKVMGYFRKYPELADTFPKLRAKFIKEKS